MHIFELLKELFKIKHISFLSIIYILLVFNEKDEQYDEYLKHLNTFKHKNMNDISMINDLFEFFDGYCDCY